MFFQNFNFSQKTPKHTPHQAKGGPSVKIMSLKSPYFSALTTGAAVFGIKITVIHLATARSRIIANHPAQPHDLDSFVLPILKIVLGCFGPDFGGIKFVERAERITKNCAENEPFFLTLATIGGLSGAIPVVAGTALIKIYTAARCAHTFVFLLGENANTSLRSVTYVTGVFATLGMAGFALGFGPKSS